VSQAAQTSSSAADYFGWPTNNAKPTMQAASPQAAPPERPTAREAPAVATPAEADGEEADGVPSPLALPCKSDAECMTHRCNMGLAKCAFPCKSDRDCVAGATCFTQGGAMASCIPKPPP
jgi:hypothetical protein